MGFTPQQVDDMTLRELFNAIEGFYKHEENKLKSIRAMIYDAARFNAVHSAFSGKQARATSRVRFSWEKSKKVSTEPIPWEQASKALDVLTRLN